MAAFPVIYDEEDRIGAVDSCGLLHTPDDPRFDRVTRLAAYVAGTPLSLMTLVSAKRLWIKSIHGPTKHALPREVPRNTSFCTYAILESEIFVVEDATLDPRFRHKKSVTESPHIRFYAGIPVTDEAGHRLGTLCVIDHVARTLSNAQNLALRDLGAIASDLVRK